MEVIFPLFKGHILNYAKDNQVEIVSFEKKEGIKKQWRSQEDEEEKCSSTEVFS